MTGKIYEFRTPLSTVEMTLDYTKDNTYYLSIIAYGACDTEEFATERALVEYLTTVWNFTGEQIEELMASMYRWDD